MKLDATEEQQMIQAMAREFAETAIRPVAAEIDREGRFPHETVKRMGELGLMGVAIPEPWGGSGADTVAYVLALEEIAKADRKSTRLNSSHTVISYAVFCLKKKKKKTHTRLTPGKSNNQTE